MGRKLYDEHGNEVSGFDPFGIKRGVAWVIGVVVTLGGIVVLGNVVDGDMVANRTIDERVETPSQQTTLDSEEGVVEDLDMSQDEDMQDLEEQLVREEQELQSRQDQIDKENERLANEEAKITKAISDAVAARKKQSEQNMTTNAPKPAPSTSSPVQAPAQVPRQPSPPSTPVQQALDRKIEEGKRIYLGDYQIQVDGYTMGKTYDGRDAIIITYSWYNGSDKTIAPYLTFRFKGYQNGVETEPAIMVEGADIGRGQRDVRPGSGFQGYHTIVGVNDMSQPLELELDEMISFTSDPYTTTITFSQ